MQTLLTNLNKLLTFLIYFFIVFLTSSQNKLVFSIDSSLYHPVYKQNYGYAFFDSIGRKMYYLKTEQSFNSTHFLHT